MNKILFLIKKIFKGPSPVFDYNSSAVGTVYITKNKYVYTVKPELIYSKLLSDISLSTKYLLISKGFSNNLVGSYSEKLTLLITEISELADCVKKGKTAEEQGFELADIVIRSANFICCYEMEFNKEYFDSHIKKIIKNSSELKLIVPTHKYDCILSMHNIVYKLMDLMNSIDDFNDIPLIDGMCIIEQLIKLTALCEAYSDVYLGKNLHGFIKGKMSFNFTRPYKYNTCEECRQ